MADNLNVCQCVRQCVLMSPKNRRHVTLTSKCRQRGIHLKNVDKDHLNVFLVHLENVTDHLNVFLVHLENVTDHLKVFYFIWKM